MINNDTKSKKKRIILPKFLLLLGLLCGCTSNEVSPVRVLKPAFYYWRSVFSVDSTDTRYLDSIGVQKLYIKFFDVDWNDAQREVVPIAPINFDMPLPAGIQLVPTVFITNRSLEQLPDTLIDSLAARIGRRLTAMVLQNMGTTPIVEIQFDCDWSVGTQSRYFALLKAFAHLPDYRQTPLSATIRLHQIKFAARTGVPPVQRGMLMCYNMGELRQAKTRNSILDTDILERYIGKLAQYPLPLDVGLPLFSWGVVFRQGNFEGLLNGWRVADMDSISQKHQLNQNTFLLTAPLRIGNTILQKNDLVRIEQIDIELLHRTTAILAQRWSTDTANVIFYHLDKAIVQHYPSAALQSVIVPLRLDKASKFD